ncbi:MAG: hypothetical protein ACTTKL_01190 [Treponema sp.]
MQFEIESRYSEREVMRIMEENTYVPRSIFHLETDGKYFIGKLEESSFKVRRKIHYRNTFLPEIVGQLERLGSGTKINITLRLPLFVKISAVIPISVLLYGVVMDFLAEKNIAVALGSLGVLIFVAAIAVIFFKIEANIAKKKLTALFAPNYK